MRASEEDEIRNAPEAAEKVSFVSGCRFSGTETGFFSKRF
jgi:hypothetical protein